MICGAKSRKQRSQRSFRAVVYISKYVTNAVRILNGYMHAIARVLDSDSIKGRVMHPWVGGRVRKGRDAFSCPNMYLPWCNLQNGLGFLSWHTYRGISKWKGSLLRIAYERTNSDKMLGLWCVLAEFHKRTTFARSISGALWRDASTRLSWSCMHVYVTSIPLL